MKKFFLFAAVAVIGLSSCKNDGLISAQDAEQMGIARSPVSSNYSDYIISPDDAMDMVADDLKQSGGEFAKKQIADIEPLLYSDFEFELQYFEELQELGIIEMSDPMIYIVRFVDGGYALMTADRDFGVEIFHVQTGGEITKDEAISPSQSPSIPSGYSVPYPDMSLNYWANLMVALVKEKYGWKEPHITKWGDRWRLEWANGNWGNGPINIPYWSGYTKYDENLVPTSFWVSAGAPLNQYGALGTLAPAMLEFLGYHEDVNTLFNISGNWSAIKSWHGTAPAPQWTWDIHNYCKITDINTQVTYFNYLGLAKDFLLTQCSGAYPNTSIVPLVHNDNSPASGAITELIANNKPVLVQFGGVAGLAYKEDLLIDTERWSLTQNPTGNVRYSSRIWYRVSTTDPQPVDFKTIRHSFQGAFYYIAY